jgi:hypothetical protein
MARARLYYADAITADAVWSASSWAYGMGPANLATPHLAEPWRTTDQTAYEWAKVDLGAAAAISGAYVAGHDLDGSEVLTLEGHASDSWEAPTVSLDFTIYAGMPLPLSFAETSLRWWRLVLAKDAAADVRSIGRLYLGSVYECGRNPEPDSLELGYLDLTERDRSSGGQTHSAAGALLRTLKARFRAAPWSQVAAFRALAETCGTWAPFLFDLSPSNPELFAPLYATAERVLGPGAPLGALGASGAWDLELSLTEEG